MTIEKEKEKENFIRAAEAAAILAVSLGTLSQWRHRGCGPRYYKIGRVVRYRASEVRSWLKPVITATVTSRS